MTAPRFSVIIPVFNRPEEMNELFGSLVSQSYKNFEVVVVEDGSSIDCRSIVEKYRDKLHIQYFVKANSGPGPSRNFGFEKATGDYLVVFDSDCLLPATYFESVNKFLESSQVDAWGGPDRGHENFTTLQQAMAYTMSSFFTTGGIRGGRKMIGNYQPRSFNMGMSKETFNRTGGFRFDRFAEDIELSIRMKKLGLKVVLIQDAFVFHKRRATLGQFFQQVQSFGKGRALIGEVHTGEIKLVHWFPALFFIGIFIIPIVGLFKLNLAVVMGAAYLFYFLLIGFDCLFATGSVMVSLLSIPSALVQFTGYGLGFLTQKLKFLHTQSCWTSE